MKPKTSDHSYGSSESRVTGVDPFLQKLTTESLTTDLSGGSKIGTKLKSICSSLKDLPKSVGMLLIFHVLNTSVAVGGAVFGLLMLVSMALLAFAGLAVFVVRGMMSIPHKNLRYLGYVVLVLLCLLSALNTYTLIGTYAFFIAGAIGVGLFCLSVSIINWLASVDAKIADFIIPVISPNSTTDVNTQRPDGRASRVGIRGNCDRGFILPRFTKKYQAWTAILNFAILKSIAGALSAAVIVFAVILPFLALSSGGNDPVVDRWIKNPSADVGIILLLWIAGVVALLPVAAVSVQLTLPACDMLKVEQETDDQHEEVDATVLSTPLQEPNLTCFKELEAITPQPHRPPSTTDSAVSNCQGTAIITVCYPMECTL